MAGLDRPLFTPRLRLQPVTALVVAAAGRGRDMLALAIDADVPADWAGGYVFAGPSTVGAEVIARHALLVRQADRRLIGEVRFERVARQTDVYELGYAVSAAHRRQGYAVEAAAAVVDWLFDHGGAARVIAGCDMKNVASVRTLRRLGFTLDGSRRAGHAFWWSLDS